MIYHGDALTVLKTLPSGSKPGDTILDPFAGAGTTWLACLKHGREFVGIELNEEYIRIAESRIQKHCPLLALTGVSTL